MRRRLFFVSCLLFWLALPGPPAEAVVISEIHYHPPGGDEALEFVEIANDSSTPEDISGYAFVEGIQFEIPPRTILGPHELLVICADVGAFRARYDHDNAIGNFTGRLENRGERITLVNHAGVVVQSLRYRDGGKWPVAPDGTGHTLVLRSVHLDSGEPESWAQSPQLGGSPGEPNFPDDEPEVSDWVLVDAGDVWRYAKGTGPFSSPAGAWLAPAFDDGGWLQGPTGIGYGDGDDATVLDDMEDAYSSVACRKTFSLSAAELNAPGDFFLGMDYDDGFCAFLNGTEFARSNCEPAGSAPVWDELATASREAGSEVLFPVPRGLFVDGENVLAVAGYNLSLGSSDFSLLPRLVRRQTASAGPVVVEDPLVVRGATWRFRKGTGPFSTPPSAWRVPGFDDTGWLSGPSGFGFQEIGGAVVAYEVPAGTLGNQAFGGALGMDFDVNRDVLVTRLGVFDSGSDGLNLTITARLYDRSSRAELARLDFAPGSPGELVGGSRFKDVAEPILLSSGFQGTIVAEGYGGSEQNGNQGTVALGLTTNDASGSISFVGGGRYGMTPGQFPDTPDGGPADRYAAGTFEFRPSGDDGGTTVAPQGVITLLDDMRENYASLACRVDFQASPEQADAPGDLVLGVEFDDGFCAFLNGTEIARVNCGNEGEEPLWDEVASAARSAQNEQFFLLSSDLLVSGENVLAIVGYNIGVDDTDFELTARLFQRRIVGAVDSAAGVVFNELYRSSPAGAGWVEIHNRGPGPADLSGFRVTEDPDRPDPYEFPEGTVMAPGGFVVLDEGPTSLELSTVRVQLFLLAADGRVVTATTFDDPPSVLAPGSYSQCGFPDGTPPEWITETPTRGAANTVERTDTIVINEILYHPPDGRPGEFVELYNLGSETVDVSDFRFDRGIDYTIPGGTLLGAGDYLVVAENPAFILEHYQQAALGPYEGVLSNRGESVRLVDRLGNPVDKVRYHDGGRWSTWADGGGSSLELIDPRQDNAFASAWDASDETGKAAWQELSFHVTDYVPAPESELNLYLVERGACLVDDISVRRGAGANLVPNPGFESSTDSWIIGGTHVHSRRLTTERHSGAGCLQVVATGKGDTLVNRIETETSPRMTAGPYDVSLWARWLRGTNVLIVHGEYHAGPFRTTPCITCGVPEPNLSGNSMAAALRLSVPYRLGTPGEENSVTRRLREETGSINLGPVVSEVEHSPPLPDPSQSVTVTARVADSDGVTTVEVFYRTESAAGPFQSLALLDDGLHADGAPGDGVYGGQLPAFPSRTRVVFYVEAVDGPGAVERFPVDAPERTCLYLVQVLPSERLDTYNVVLDAQRSAELQSRQLHSNDLLDGAFVFENERAYYNVGTRYRGSPWGRPSRASVRVRFPEDDLFHRGLRDMNISKTGSGPGEGAGLFLIGRNARPGRPAPVADYLYISAWINGSSFGRKAMIQSIDGSFLDKWYGQGSLGPLLKANGRFVFTDAGSLIGQNGWEGASLIYRGENPEHYRGYFFHATRQTADDWRPLFALTRILDRSESSDSLFAEEVENVVDLDAFFRVLSTRILLGDGDAWGVNNGHNGYIAYDSLTGHWGILPFDVEAAFRGNFNLLSSLDPGVQRLLSHPKTRRSYLRVLSDHVDGYWSVAAAGPWLDAVQGITGYGMGGIKNHITANASRVRTTVGPFQGVEFRILTNAGNDLETGEPAIEIEGEAPLEVDTILYRQGDDDPGPLASTWTSPTSWRAVLDLPDERNEFEFFAFNSSGDLIGSVRFVVTNSSQRQFAVTGWFPDTGPASGGTAMTFFGNGFTAGARVFFGGVGADAVVVQSSQVLLATSPAATLPLPSGGRVDVELVIDGASLVLEDAFTYTLEGGLIRGDANADGAVDISDAVFTLRFLFLGAQADLRCEKSADADDSGSLNISDPIFLLSSLFLSGPPPPPPHPGCGFDTTDDGLTCEEFPVCEG